MVHIKTPQKPSTHVNFHDVNLVDIIKASYHQSDFVETDNEPSNINPTRNDNYTDRSRKNDTTPTSIPKIEKVSNGFSRKLLSSFNPSYTLKLKEITIDGNVFDSLTLRLSMCPITISHIVNHWLIGVTMGEFQVSILLSSVHTYTSMKTFEASIIMRLHK